MDIRPSQHMYYVNYTPPVVLQNKKDHTWHHNSYSSYLNTDTASFNYSTIPFQPLHWNLKLSSINKSQLNALFCICCSNPMELIVRLEPCFHLACFNCTKTLKNSFSNCCPGCHENIVTTTAVHPQESLYTCSGHCLSQEIEKVKVGRTFFNEKSLKYHEMFFHKFNTSENESRTTDIQSITDNKNNSTWCDRSDKITFSDFSNSQNANSSNTRTEQYHGNNTFHLSNRSGSHVNDTDDLI